MKASNSRLTWVGSFVCSALAWGAAAARAADSAAFRLDTRGGTRVARETEAIAYSTEWNHGASVRVAADGVVLKEAAGPASGEVVWNAAGAGDGLHTLTHVSGGETLTAAFTVGREAATVTLGGLSRVYDGTPKPVSVATEPEGLAVAVTYDGSVEVPTGAGSYAVSAVVDDGVWAGFAERVLEIAKGAQTIEFAEIGTQRTTNTVVLDATASSGLPVSYAVEGPAVADGNVLAFTGVGMVRVTASQAGDANWEAAADVERVFGVGMATVTLGGLSRVYDGTPKPVEVETVPEGLAVAVTYDGSVEAPTGAGSYAVSAVVEDDDWVGSAEGVLVIAKGAQTIEFASIGTHKTTDTVVLGATASSGLEVGYAVEGPAVVEGNVLTFTGEAGTVRVTASQAGDANWEAAADVSRSFEVWKATEPVRPGISGAFRLDTRSGTRFAGETETLAYSTEWSHGGSVRVDVDGVVLKEAAAPASGEVVWNAAEAGDGFHTLTHASGGETWTAVFAVGEAMAMLTFDRQGGAGGTGSALAIFGCPMPPVDVPSRPGYTFGGYFGEPDGGGTAYYAEDGSSAHDWDNPVPAATLFAYWTASQTVTFNANGGTCPVSAADYRVGAEYGELPAAERKGHAFGGWWTAKTGGKAVTAADRVETAGARTLWAHWTTKQALAYDANGGTCKAKGKTCTIGKAYGTLATPIWAGHAFLGWWTEKDGGTQLTAKTKVDAVAARTAYAHWTTEQVVAFAPNGGSVNPSERGYAIGEEYGSLPVATKAGSAFAGWWTAKSGGKKVTEGSKATESAARTLWAHWTKTQTLAYDANGGKCKTKSKKCTIGKKYGALAAATRAGYGFTGWWTEREGGIAVTAADWVTEFASRTVYAQWTTNQIVAFDANGGSCEESERTYGIGTAYGDLPTAAKAGAAFAGWYTAKKNGTKVTEASKATDAAARTLYAHWTTTQTLAYDANGGKCKTKSKKCTIGKKYGTLAAATRAGFGFTGWWTEREGGEAVTAEDLVTEFASRTVYAQWTTEQVVSFDANGGNCGEAERVYAIGAAYGDLPTAVKAGAAFAGWYTAKKNGKKVTEASKVTEAAARTLYAHWTTSQTVTFNANGGKCSTKSKKYTVGKTYGSLPKATWKGHVFSGWATLADGGEAVAVGDAVPELAARTLYAQWDAAPRAKAVGEICGIAVAAGAFDGRRARGMDSDEEGVCVLLLETVAGTEYELQWTETLGGEWTCVKRWVADEDGLDEVEVPVPAGAVTGFFRLAARE
jgi:hypothetical protein